ncbi:ATP-binding cassette domain-containing protein [Cochlodiniinecator piscidefendens]|uniref:ATP-binding cassette domain-containing protein n=1 Tax=Cochlodiniinecator piscidefendens TaxID=2715756 RepID=UPI00140DAE73|nr:ATP-binding cassette domain-containing protein [Cochlodiniinecator piscidefendens]
MAEPRIIPFPDHDTQGKTVTSDGIKVQNLYLERDGQPLLRGVNLGLNATGVTALIGPNGAGKSLLLKCIAGILQPDGGSIDLPETQRFPALVFQKPVLLRRSVRSNLLHALKLAKVPRKLRPGRLAELLVLADLTRQSEAPARALSGGEQQRLAMVRALAAKPQLLLLDEPTASLDPAATSAIEELTKRTAHAGVKVILVTHNCAQARRLADDVAFLSRGQVTEHSAAETFFADPKSDGARAYLSSELILQP